jgi:hypothetical protein
MGEVLAFRQGPTTGASASALTPAKLIALGPRRAKQIAASRVSPPATLAPAKKTASMWSIWSDPDNWATSIKGNPFIKLTNARTGCEYCVTIFPRRGSWSWCIARNGEPIWSPDGYETERQARDAAWSSLEKLEGR